MSMLDPVLIRFLDQDLFQVCLKIEDRTNIISMDIISWAVLLWKQYWMKTSKVLLRAARGNRESGESPERSRHCNGEALFDPSHSHSRGRQKRKLMIQSQETYLACVTEPFAERNGVRRIRNWANKRFAWLARLGSHSHRTTLRKSGTVFLSVRTCVSHPLQGWDFFVFLDKCG